MALEINGVSYQLNKGHLIKDSLTSELHSITLSFQVSGKEHNINKYDIVNFENNKWFISSIDYQLISNNRYTCSLILTELTLILEKYILSPCSFTKETDVLWRQVEKVLYKVEPLRIDEVPRFKTSTNLMNFLSSDNHVLPSEDFVYTERMTLREILDDMLGGYGIRCFVEDVNNDFSEIIIGYLDLNKKSDDIKTLTKIVSEDLIDSAEYYANEFDISVVNTQSKEKLVMTQEWSTMKPTILTEESDSYFKLIVDNPIEELLQVRASFVADVDYTFRSLDGKSKDEGTEYSFYFNIDISQLFLEKEIYDTLPINVQKTYIPYERGSKELGVMISQKVLFFTYSVLRNSLFHLAEADVRPFIENKWGSSGMNLTEVTPKLPTATNMINEILFKVKYYPFMDFRFKQSKLRKDIDVSITSVLNQTERSIDIDKYSKQVRTLANRTGNKEMIVNVSLNNRNDLLELGDQITNDFSLISREVVINNANYIRATYNFYQHYEANVNARLSRERRLFNIPQENLVDRSILIKDNLLISTNSLNVNNDSSLNNSALKEIVNSFDKTKPQNFISRLLFQTRDEANNLIAPESGYFVLGFAGKALGNSLIWQAKTYDNYSVGYSSGKKVIGGREVLANPYVDDYGEFENLTFEFVNTKMDSLSFNKQLQIGKSLPVITDTMSDDYIDKVFTNGGNASKYLFKKDRLETMQFVYQLEAKSNDVIIGNHFMRFINLLENKDKSDLRIWVSTNDVYLDSDINVCKGTKVVSSYDIIANDTTHTISVNYPINNVKSWAIGTENGRLLLAVNNNNQNINTIYFGLKRN